MCSSGVDADGGWQCDHSAPHGVQRPARLD